MNNFGPESSRSGQPEPRPLCRVAAPGGAPVARSASEREVETDPDAARLQRRDLVLFPDQERRPQRKTVATCVEEVSDREAEAKAIIPHAHIKARIDVIALKTSQDRPDTQGRLADVAGVAAYIEVMARPELAGIAGAQPATAIRYIGKPSLINGDGVVRQDREGGIGDPAVVQIKSSIQFKPGDRSPPPGPADR